MIQSLQELITNHTLAIAPEKLRATTETNDRLFALERNGAAGNAISSALRASSDLKYPEFMPEGLSQTYRDQKTGLELPLFGVFPLNSESATISYEIQAKPAEGPLVKFHPVLNTLKCFSDLRQYLVPNSVVQSVFQRGDKKILMQSIAVGVGFMAVAAVMLTVLSINPKNNVAILEILPWVLLASIAIALVIGAILSDERDRISLRLTASFDGLLPQEIRKKAREAANEFDDLFLITDQRDRWVCEILPTPRPPNPDPLLIGSREGKIPGTIT
jgi:hypothetical protein